MYEDIIFMHEMFNFMHEMFNFMDENIFSCMKLYFPCMKMVFSCHDFLMHETFCTGYRCGQSCFQHRVEEMNYLFNLSDPA